MTDVQKAAWTLAQFCERYPCSRTKAYDEIREGRLKARKIGRRTIILDEDARAWAANLPTMESKAA